MPQSTAHRIGTFLGRRPIWVWVTLVLATLGWILWLSEAPRILGNPPAIANNGASAKAVRAATESENIRSECQASIESRRVEYNALMKGNKFWEASLVLRVCAGSLESAELTQLVKDAETKSHLADLRDPEKSADNRSLAFERLAKDYPEVAAKNEQFARQQIAAAERKEQAEERKQKRSRGVHIGMSKDDALASSWGKPEKINTTTNVYGTREQWVYGGSGYLYFENGVLTSIQN